ncbi:hypothetical protein ACCO45_008253 [Purpureocillium lilacinum]|uniref:Uncharacterized protein n=1 Tax=Purpureocillium lilacinum TaxID=33203 RepID=A0ACC4DMR2_PURLI
MNESSPSDVSAPDKPPQPPPHPHSQIQTQAQAQPAHPAKRTRVLLSCGPCRASKLKCDRLQPCSQCAKKSRPELCVYAPRPVKKRPPRRGMSARLQRLEGMVRNMLDESGEARPGARLRGTRRPSRAMWFTAGGDDIEDLKTYFQDEAGDDDEASPTDELDAPEMLLWSAGDPGTEMSCSLSCRNDMLQTAS